MKGKEFIFGIACGFVLGVSMVTIRNRKGRN
jgi:hypothetical protein